MPPKLALLICILFIIYILWMDRKNIDGVSKAIWIPMIWMLIASSRFISHWLNLGTPVMSTDIEGSPLDRAVFLILMYAGVIILIRRRLNLGALFINNSWLWLFFTYCAASIIWSEYPYISMKRWGKALGNLIMVLVILTEQRPYEAVGIILRRIAILLLPLSVLFIKYYPHLGRVYHMGFPLFTGVADHKNGLGQMCLVSGIYFSWNLILNHSDIHKIGRPHLLNSLIILFILFWLLYKANSATSLICIIIAVVLFAVGRLPAMARKPRRIITLAIACTVVFWVLNITFELSKIVITTLGRRPDLTNRVPMWNYLIDMVKNPIIGFGYGSFWLGGRKDLIGERWGIAGQAHNGYLQVYLDLGFIGLFILVGWIISGLKKEIQTKMKNWPQKLKV